MVVVVQVQLVNLALVGMGGKLLWLLLLGCLERFVVMSPVQCHGASTATAAAAAAGTLGAPQHSGRPLALSCYWRVMYPM